MLQINWNETLCQHAGICVNSLPQVFKIEDRKFVIDATAADETAIRETCGACPSGALTLED